MPHADRRTTRGALTVATAAPDAAYERVLADPRPVTAGFAAAGQDRQLKKVGGCTSDSLPTTQRAGWAPRTLGRPVAPP